MMRPPAKGEVWKSRKRMGMTVKMASVALACSLKLTSDTATAFLAGYCKSTWPATVPLGVRMLPVAMTGTRRQGMGRRVAKGCSMMADDMGGEVDRRLENARKKFESNLGEGNTKECIRAIRQSGADLALDIRSGSKLLDEVAKEVLNDPSQAEEDLLNSAYNALKDVNLLPGFGYIEAELVPAPFRNMSPEKLNQLTGMDQKSLTPSRPAGSWALAGIALCGLEFVLGTAAGVDPLDGIIPLTAGLFIADKALLGGAVVETVTRKVVPLYSEKIVCHEAGHFLVAYLMGCPVQGCLLDPFEIRKIAPQAQGGTIFADPILAKGMSSGRLKRSTIDRFSIVLMGGIAAEAIQYGTSEGGASDEGLLIEILSTIAPPFDLEQIKAQARWAVVQAVLIIKEHKGAYDALVEALNRKATLGECVTVLEAELAKAPLPAAKRKVEVKTPSVGESVRKMMLQRMDQKQWQQEDQRAKEAKNGVENNDIETIKSQKIKAIRQRIDDIEAAMGARDGPSESNDNVEKENAPLHEQILSLGKELLTVDNETFDEWTVDLAKNRPGVGLNIIEEDTPNAAIPETIPDGTVETPPVVALDGTGAGTTTTTTSQGVSPQATTTATAAAKGGSGSVSKEKLEELDRKAAENAARLAEVESRLDDLKNRV